MIAQSYGLLALALGSAVDWLGQFLRALPLMEASIFYACGLTLTVSLLVLPFRGGGISRGSDKAKTSKGR